MSSTAPGPAIWGGGQRECIGSLAIRLVKITGFSEKRGLKPRIGSRGRGPQEKPNISMFFRNGLNTHAREEGKRQKGAGANMGSMPQEIKSAENWVKGGDRLIKGPCRTGRDTGKSLIGQTFWGERHSPEMTRGFRAVRLRGPKKKVRGIGNWDMCRVFGIIWSWGGASL